MRLISCSVENFASYKSLKFNYVNQGLTLIQGTTGSGKSTLCDIVPWILFGTTAKGGAADEVLSWPGDQVTKSSLHLETHSGAYIIKRSRGPKGKDNDLSYLEVGGEVVRGKDLLDTQKLINSILGVDSELYLSGAYFHEFSSTSSFFNTTAKIRRQITEQIVDLNLAKNLSVNLGEYKKALKKEIEVVATTVTTKKNHLSYLSKSIDSFINKAAQWNVGTQVKMDQLQTQYATFEAEKSKNIENIKNNHLKKQLELEYDISLLEKDLLPRSYFTKAYAAIDARKAAFKDTVCSECGAKKDVHIRMLIDKEGYSVDNARAKNEQTQTNLVRMHQQLNKLNETLDPLVKQEQSRKNTYLQQIKELASEVNPFLPPTEEAKSEKDQTKAQLTKLANEAEDLSIELSDLELLLEVIASFRAHVVKDTIEQLETSTNNLLSTYFDAEIKIQLIVQDADKVEVVVYKDGNTCVYSQLSKGQRQLLKLCFGISVMKTVSNHSGISFSTIFLDECTDGIDESMKGKAYRLFEQLSTEYENVFVTEHSESLKSMFPKRLEVTLNNGESSIEES